MSNPSASLIHEPHAFHTSPMLLTLAICGPRTFFVVPVPHTMPLKAIVVLSTSFSPLERSIVPGQAFRRMKMASTRSWRRVLPVAKGCRTGGSRCLPASQGRYLGISRLYLTQLSRWSVAARFSAQRSSYFQCCGSIAEVKPPKSPITIGVHESISQQRRAQCRQTVHVWQPERRLRSNLSSPIALHVVRSSTSGGFHRKILKETARALHYIAIIN